MELKPYGRTDGAPCELRASSYPGLRLPLFERGPPPWAISGDPSGLCLSGLWPYVRAPLGEGNPEIKTLF